MLKNRIFSKVGAVFSIIYLIAAAFAVGDYQRCQGGWINLCSLVIGLVIVPSEETLGYLMTSLGIPPINYTEPKFPDIAQIILHLAVCTLLFYFLGFVIEKLFGKLFSRR